MTTKEVLQAALTRLGVDGSSWTKGMRVGDKVCAGVAILRAINPQGTSMIKASSSYKQLEDSIHTFSNQIISKNPSDDFQIKLPTQKLIEFNDNPTTTFQDIKETFERAIAAA